MYLRKWTRMRWYDKIDLLNKLYIKKPPEIYQIMSRFPPVPFQQERTNNGPVKRSQDPELLKDLFERYPDLKYTNVSYGEPGTNSLEGNYVIDFIFHQKNLIKKGYTKEKAFEMTEKKFQDRFNKKINESLIANNLAYDNQLRSLLSVAEQTAEAEARFKVQRMTRDLFFYKTAQEKSQKTLKELEEELEQEAEGQQAEEQIEDDESVTLFGKKYKRVLHRIVPADKANLENPETAVERKQVIDEFIDNTQNMFKLYYERASALDRLSGLTEAEIMQSVAGRPTKLKRESKKLLTLLRKYNITLDANGDVDFSACPYPHVVKKLQQNPLVKITLLQEDLQYEFPHKEVQMELARKVREDYDEYKKDRERYKKIGAVEEKEETVAADDSPFHKQFGITYPKAETFKTTNQKEAIPTQDLNDQELLSPDASYRIFETYEERTARLEKKWLRTRLASLEPGVEKPSAEEQNQVLQQAIEKLRRVKYLVDQKNVENAKDLIFEEHKVFTQEEILIDKDVNSEKLIHYLRNPEDKRRLTQADEVDDDKMLRMIARKNIVEDTVTPFENYADKRLGEEDTREYKEIEIKQRKLEAEKKRLIKEALQEKDQQAEPEVIAPKADSKEAGKADRKKLVDYIKAKTEKNADKNAKKKEK